MKRIMVGFVLGMLTLSSATLAIAQQSSEKPLIIKGMRIGMDINEARTKMLNLLGKDWKVSPVGKKEDLLADYRLGDYDIFLGQVPIEWVDFGT